MYKNKIQKTILKNPKSPISQKIPKVPCHNNDRSHLPTTPSHPAPLPERGDTRGVLCVISRGETCPKPIQHAANNQNISRNGTIDVANPLSQQAEVQHNNATIVYLP